MTAKKVPWYLYPYSTLLWLIYIPCEKSREKAEAVYRKIIWDDPTNLLWRLQFSLFRWLCQFLWQAFDLLGGNSDRWDNMRQQGS